MQFGFMPVKGTIDGVFIIRRQQEKYHAKGKKLYVFCGHRESFDRIPRKVMEWTMRKKVIPDVLVGLVMSMCGGTKTRV